MYWDSEWRRYYTKCRQSGVCLSRASDHEANGAVPPTDAPAMANPPWQGACLGVPQRPPHIAPDAPAATLPWSKSPEYLATLTSQSQTQQAGVAYTTPPLLEASQTEVPPPNEPAVTEAPASPQATPDPSSTSAAGPEGNNEATIRTNTASAAHSQGPPSSSATVHRSSGTSGPPGQPI